MAKKSKSSGEIAKIKKALEEKKLIIGSERTIKILKQAGVSEIFITSNCADKVKNDLEHYSKLQKVKIVKLKINNEDLGIVCKKPFSISVVGIAA